MPVLRKTSCALLLCATLLQQQAYAQQSLETTFSYRTVSVSVEDFLKSFARDAEIRIQSSNSVSGRLGRMTIRGSTNEILDAVTRTNDLDWFAFNNVYYISRRDEVLTRIIRLGDLAYEDAIAVLEASGLVDARYPIRATANESAVSVTGPPRLVVIIESVIEGIPSREAIQATQNTVVVRRGISIDREVVDRSEEGSAESETQ